MGNQAHEILAERRQLNQELNEHRPRLRTFVEDLLLPSYEDGFIDAKTKHLIGLAVSIHINCQDGIVFHVNECHRLGLEEAVILECLELCILDGGSLIYPNSRIALKTLHELRSMETIS